MIHTDVDYPWSVRLFTDPNGTGKKDKNPRDHCAVDTDQNRDVQHLQNSELQLCALQLRVEVQFALSDPKYRVTTAESHNVRYDTPDLN